VIRWPMIIERGCSMAKPELCCEQMVVQVGRLTMRVEREMEGAARLDKSGEGRRQSERQEAIMDIMRDIVSDAPKGSCGIHPAWPSPPYPRRKTNALAIHKTDARCPHPPHRSPRQAQA
jgi:hypothetical protein